MSKKEYDMNEKSSKKIKKHRSLGGVVPYIYIHIYIYIYTYTYIHIYIHTYRERARVFYFSTKTQPPRSLPTCRPALETLSMEQVADTLKYT